MAKNYTLKAESGQYGITGANTRLTHTATSRALRRNWLWASAYVLATVVGWIAAYAISGWWSLAVAVLVTALTFVFGYKMVQTVITIVRTER